MVPAAPHGRLVRISLEQVCRWLGMKWNTFIAIRTRVRGWRAAKEEFATWIERGRAASETRELHAILVRMFDNTRILPHIPKDERDAKSPVGITAAEIQRLIIAW